MTPLRTPKSRHLLAHCVGWLVLLTLGAACASVEPSVTPSAAQTQEQAPEPTPTPEPAAADPTVAPEPTSTPEPTPAPTATPEPPAATAVDVGPDIAIEDFGFDRLSLGDSREDVIASLGEPDETTEFLWMGSETGYVLNYGDVMVEIHYGVSSFEVSRPGLCTTTGLCIGDSLAAVEQTYGRGTPSTNDLQPGVDRAVRHTVTGGGYCEATFGFANTDTGDVLQSISGICAPD